MWSQNIKFYEKNQISERDKVRHKEGERDVTVSYQVLSVDINIVVEIQSTVTSVELDLIMSLTAT